MTSNQSTAKLPTIAQAVEIIGMQLSRSEQANQLRYMRETPGEAFAQQVKAKVVAAGKARVK